MHIRKKILSLLFFVLFILSFGQIKVENPKGLVIGKLSNGMTYYIYKNKMPENRVSVNVAVKSGSLQEDDDQLGMAHLIEHLCFNGTEKYSKNEVVKYYQSIGLNFGGDLNAHTGFDETVYKIQIPTDDKEKFEKGIEVLKEMTLKPTFKQEDIDSEKDIVKEEWRLSQGLSDRLTKVYQKEIFEGSRYGERFPIGDMDIISNTKRDTLVRYYNKWYHPENMAVVMVGDIEPEYAKEVIKKYFDYNETRKFIPRGEYRLKELPDKYTVFQDKELTYVLFEMMSREDYSFKNNEEKVKDYYENILFKLLLSNRINDEIKTGNNLIYEGGYFGMEFSKDRLNTYYSILNKNDIEKGIEKTISILKDMAINGVSQNELETEKENLRSSFEDSLKNKDSLESETIISEVRKVFLNNEIFIDEENMLKYYDEFSKNITTENIKEKAIKFYKDNHSVVLFTPKEKDIKVPSDVELKNIILNAEKQPVSKKSEMNFNLSLEKPEIISGKILETKDMKNYKKIKLSNGIEFLYKKTDFEKDKIYIKLFKEEGSIKDSDTMYLNSIFATELVNKSGAGNIKYQDVDRFMKGKEFSVETYINNFEQGVFIVSNNKDIDTALDYFTYVVKEPQVAQEAYKYITVSAKEMIENRKNSPDTTYSDKIIQVFFNDDIRKKSIEIKDLNSVTVEKIKDEYRDKFSEFNGFKGVIIGSIDDKKVSEILEKYFASLPVKESKEDVKKEYLDIKYPNGTIYEKVVKGDDKKVRVSLFYPLKVSYSQENSYMSKTFEDILRINLIDEIREKLAGVYGISPNVFMSKNENGYLQIRFSTDPKRADEITEAVKKEVGKLVDGEIKKSSLESVVKNYKLVYENSQKQNSFWLNYLDEKLKRGEGYEPYTPKEFEEKMNEIKLKDFFKKIIDKNNCVQVRLIPETVK